MSNSNVCWYCNAPIGPDAVQCEPCDAWFNEHSTFIEEELERDDDVLREAWNRYSHSVQSYAAILAIVDLSDGALKVVG